MKTRELRAILAQMKAEDRDPALWPVRGKLREFMDTCARCGAKYAPVAREYHARKCK